MNVYSNNGVKIAYNVHRDQFSLKKREASLNIKPATLQSIIALAKWGSYFEKYSVYQFDTTLEIVKLGENIILSLEIKNYSTHIIIETDFFGNISSKVDEIMSETNKNKTFLRSKRENDIIQRPAKGDI